MKLQKGFIFQTGNIIKTSDTNRIFLKKQAMAFDKNATGGNYSPVSPQPRLVKSIHSDFVRWVLLLFMVVRVVEFSSGGYKIGNIFA